MAEGENGGENGGEGGGQAPASGDGQAPASGDGQAPVVDQADWRSTFPDELKSAPSLRDFTDVEALAASYVEQSQFLGNAIRPPGPEASSEARQKFYAQIQEHAGDKLVPRPDPEDQETINAYAKAMGRPDDATGYTPPQIDNFDNNLFDAARDTFHSLGLTNKQAQGLAEYRFKAESATMEANMAERNRQHGELEQEWGVTYQPRIDNLGKWLKADNAPEDIADHVKDLPSSQVKFLFDIYTRLGAGGEANNNQRGDEPAEMPPAEALSRANEIMTRLHKMHPGDPEYQGLVMKRVEYMKMANPTASQNLNDLRANPELQHLG